MMSQQPPSTQPVEPHNNNRVAVLLAGYGEVESYRDLSSYNQAATKYIASQFVSIPERLYPAAGWFLGLLDLYDFGFKHHHFMSPENEMFEKQRIGIEQQLQKRWGSEVEVFKGFYFCKPFVQEVVTEIVGRDFQNLLIFPLLVVDSAFTGKIAVEQVNEVIAANKSKDLPFQAIRYIPAFATEPTYIDLLVRQIKESLNKISTSGYFESQIGVILTVHGGPEKANGLLTGVIDGQALFDRVQAQLQHQYPLISIGWINHDMPFIKWSQPNLEQAAKSLIGSGAQTIVFKPLGWVTENYETILDVEDAILKLRGYANESLQRHYPTVTYTRLECVNDDPDFLSIAAAWANLQIEAMLSLPHGSTDARSSEILDRKSYTNEE
jgi:protoporphyrin/coproporphyrin ferrochelatase